MGCGASKEAGLVRRACVADMRRRFPRFDELTYSETVVYQLDAAVYYWERAEKDPYNALVAVFILAARLGTETAIHRKADVALLAREIGVFEPGAPEGPPEHAVAFREMRDALAEAASHVERDSDAIETCRRWSRVGLAASKRRRRPFAWVWNGDHVRGFRDFLYSHR